MTFPFAVVSPATRGLSLALTRHLLQHTSLPIFATHRPSTSSSTSSIREHILSTLTKSSNSIDPSRLTLLPLDLTSEDSIRDAANLLASSLPKDRKDAYMKLGFFTGGVLLNPEKSPKDLDWEDVKQTFQINVISHMLIMKHFARFLPAAHTPTRTTLYDNDNSSSGSSSSSSSESGNSGNSGNNSSSRKQATPLSKWVHVSARVGSISSNKLGGWYSYRSSKAALNQSIRSFDLHLKQKHIPAMCVGVHPGTMKTQLSKEFWGSVSKEKLFEPEDAAMNVVKVVEGLEEDQRGRVWDWEGKEVLP